MPQRRFEDREEDFDEDVFVLRDGLVLREGDDERLEEGDEYVVLDDFDVPTRTDGDEDASDDDRLWPA